MSVFRGQLGTPRIAAERRAAARLLLAAAPPRPCSNQSTSPGRRALSSKPTATACGSRMGQTNRRTDGRPTVA